MFQFSRQNSGKGVDGGKPLKAESSCTSHARRGRDGFPNKGEEREKKTKYSMQGIYVSFAN